MARPKYDAEKEHEIIGMYPGIQGMELGGGGKGGDDAVVMNIVPETPRFWRPIEPRENYKMLFEGKKPYWMPYIGWIACDVEEFRPRQSPDCYAHHQCLDGGPFIDYSTWDPIQRGWFGLDLEWEPMSGGVTTRPGNPILDDINDWKEKIPWPNLDEIDFEEMGEMNKEYLGTDKCNQLGIQLGMWERLMCLMDVENAAVALIDEDQEDALHEFLDALVDFYIDYIERVTKVCRIDSIMFHDDWGTQNAPFFSLETAMDIFVPHMKRLIDFVHSKGIVFEHHCCGHAMELVPAMIAEGDDYWFPQPAINDLDYLIEKYKDEPITFAIVNPKLPVGSSEEEVRAIAKAFVDKYADKGVLWTLDVAGQFEPGHDASLFPLFQDAVYEYSRIHFQDVED